MTRRHRWLVVALLLVGASGAPAQNTVVLPDGYAARNGLISLASPTPRGSELPVHSLFAYDIAPFPAPTAQVTGCAFRRSYAPWFTPPAIDYQMTFVLSVGPNPPHALSPVFQSNLGADATQVFTGTVSWPALPPVQKHQVEPFRVFVPFSRPFALLRSNGPSLVLDTYVSGSNSADYWRPDTAAREYGRFVDFNGSPMLFCRDRNGGQVTIQGSTDMPHVGGSFAPVYSATVPNAQGFWALGFSGVGGSWLGHPLPIMLSGWFGYTMTDCAWLVDIAIALPWTSNATGTAYGTPILIPNSPALVWKHFFQQGALFDPLRNAAGIVPFFSTEYEIGSNQSPPVGRVSASRDNPPSPTGYVSDFAPVLQLTYR